MKARRRNARSQLERPETIDAILARSGEDRFAPHQPPVSLVVWRTAVGPRIADQAIPIGLEHGVLMVRASSSTWAQELQMLSDTIVLRLATHGIKVRRIVFRTGRLETPHRPVERRTTRLIPAPVPLPPMLAREMEGIQDDELRSIIENAASRALAFSESPRGARGPRGAEKGSAPQGRTSRADPEGPTRNRGGGRGRSR